MKKTKTILTLLISLAMLVTGCQQTDTGKNPPSSQIQSQEKTIIEEDYSSYFENMKGSAVFYSEKENAYKVYNQELAEQRTSPCSSFKMISCLMGLEKGVINPNDSTVKWDGTVYPIESWNKDLDYKQAFKASAIWYFRNVIDQLGNDYIQNVLTNLEYGNCDISQWEGSKNNLIFPDIKDFSSINGFWQESSLKISPMEQVEVVHKIFTEKSIFSQQNIDLLKEVMLVDNTNTSIKIYGKTGSGKDENRTDAWFVGFFEQNGEATYFAIRLNEPNTTGQNAKEIAMRIINNYAMN